jgi:hypothetical protein
MGEDALTRNAFNGRVRAIGFEDKAAKVGQKAQKCWMHLTLEGTGLEN